MSDVKLDGAAIYPKLKKLSQNWNKDDFNAVLMVIGKVQDESERPLTTDFFLWLLNWEFSDTIMMLTQSKVIFAVSPKKAKLLRDASNPPASYDGPQLVVIEANPRSETPAQIFEKLQKEIEDPSAPLTNIAVFLKDKEDGDLTRTALEQAKNLASGKLVEYKPHFDRANQIKSEQELKNLEIASAFTEWSFSRLVEEVEDIIENDTQVKHATIQKKIESSLDDDSVLKKFISKYPSVDPQFLDYPLPVLIQSGSEFNLHKFQVDSNTAKLQAQTIYINCCGKFCDMSAMVSRTLLVNPNQAQKEAYLVCLGALEKIVDSLRIGEPICNAYLATKDFITKQNPHLQFHSNFGFGIGFNYKEDQLIINEANQTVVRAGMTFHTRIAFSGVHKETGRSVVAAGDTLVIRSSGPEIVTSRVQKKYNEISYSLEDTEEVIAPAPGKKAEQADEEEESGSNDVVVQGRTGTSVIKSSRLRSKADQQQERLTEAEERKEHQLQLYKERQKDLRQRYSRGEIQCATKKEKVKRMELLQAYKDESQYPKDLVPGQLYVDVKRAAVLVPNTPHSFIPFHVSAIKSVSDTIQGQWTYLRLNLYCQSIGNMQFPPQDALNALWVKELTLKCKSTGANNRLSAASRQIKELMKNVKTQEAHSEFKAANVSANAPLEALVMNKQARREQLDNLVIRPNIVGKKSIGTLEIHQNGLRFLSHKGEKVDVCFSNVKHCFFQPCASDELIVLIHFNLRQQIMVGNKKVQDVQFYKESGVAAEDINFSGGRQKYNDMDELQQEEAERQARKRLNQKFLTFAKLIEQASSASRCPIEVDIPEEDLQFYGCPCKTLVRIRPTKSCLVALSETPFFVLDTSEIELVCFERVYFGIKNFDVAVIFKDFQTFKRIDSIPIEYYEELKSYWDSIDVIYAETNQPFKWNSVLQEMRENFQDYLESGVWDFLLAEDSEGEEGEDSELQDPDEQFNEEQEEEDDDSDVSGFSDEDSSELQGEELSEEGLSWSDLDRQAEEDDRRNATRRLTDRQQVPKPTGRRR